MAQTYRVAILLHHRIAPGLARSGPRDGSLSPGGITRGRCNLLWSARRWSSRDLLWNTRRWSSWDLLWFGSRRCTLPITAALVALAPLPDEHSRGAQLVHDARLGAIPHNLFLHEGIVSELDFALRHATGTWGAAVSKGGVHLGRRAATRHSVIGPSRGWGVARLGEKQKGGEERGHFTRFNLFVSLPGATLRGVPWDTRCFLSPAAPPSLCTRGRRCAGTPSATRARRREETGSRRRIRRTTTRGNGKPTLFPSPVSSQFPAHATHTEERMRMKRGRESERASTSPKHSLARKEVRMGTLVWVGPAAGALFSSSLSHVMGHQPPD